ncbi:hypothetical protein ACS8E3_08175 [Psychrobacter sp. 2Y5]|uniref:tetratricopeptide repeat protein n=1 Tax=unclassified Psychrobacter TaxID=196806 RepID=UPI003F478083
MKHNATQKFATLTALAAACTMLLTVPALAAPDSVAANVPSAKDSSQRIIRRAQPNAAINSAQPANAQPDAQASAQPNPAQSNVATPATATANNVPSESGLATRVYQRGPITSTGIDISQGQLRNIPAPQAKISDISFISTVLIPTKQGVGADKLDVSLIDHFIEDVSPNARHYPPNFPNRSQRYYTREKIKVLADWIDPFASAPDASYEVLVRAAKLNGMGRNLDLGSDYAVRGGKYIDRAIKAKPDSGEANFLYGMMLSEGGGFKEGQKYLDKAVSLGYTEAEQSLAQSDLLSDRRSEALSRLRRLEQKTPDNQMIRQQIKLIEDGKYYIWDIPAPDIDISPNSINQTS